MLTDDGLNEMIRTLVHDAHEEPAGGPPGVYSYGYFWYPGTLKSGINVIQAVGNGDQRGFVLPDVGLAITVFAGSYNDFRHSVGERIFEQILMALR